MAAKQKSVTRAVGIDVSAKTLDVAIEGLDRVLTFDNNAKGHKALIKVLTKGGRSARVVLEPTSTYHLDAAISLAQHPSCEVMVANARATKHFHEAMNVRAKTDKVDAASLRDFARTMPFTAWSVPDAKVLELRAYARRVGQLIKEQTRLKNQLHAARSASATPTKLMGDIEEDLDYVQKRIQRTQEYMRHLVASDRVLGEHVKRLSTMPGIGNATAVGMLAEFLLLDVEMTSKEITAWAGLDPRPRESGTSLKGKRSISKRGSSRTRAMLFMPAMAAARVPGPFRDLFERVTATSSFKRKGVTAVMRKLLIVAWAIFRQETTWQPAKAASRTQSIEVAA